jgi:hypothetical protein
MFYHMLEIQWRQKVDYNQIPPVFQTLKKNEDNESDSIRPSLKHSLFTVADPHFFFKMDR